MTKAYDGYYKTENLFGEPYPELIDFFNQQPRDQAILDLGCGQGRDAIALARMGFKVTGIDSSKVGINQMNRIAEQEQLDLQGEVGDVNFFDAFNSFGVVLLDSMFHFTKRSKQGEIRLLQQIMDGIRIGGILVICIQDSGKKVETLKKVLGTAADLQHLIQKSFMYRFRDDEQGTEVATKYMMIAVQKTL